MRAEEIPFLPRGRLKEIYQRSKGIPRLINILCDNSLLTGYAQDQKVVDKKMIREAAKDLHLEENRLPQRYWYGIAGVAIIIFLLLVAYKTSWSYANFLTSLSVFLQEIR